MTVGELKEKLKSLGFKVLLLALYSVYCESLKNKEATLNVPKEASETKFWIFLELSALEPTRSDLSNGSSGEGRGRRHHRRPLLAPLEFGSEQGESRADSPLWISPLWI
jgi:hypothetical protein